MVFYVDITHRFLVRFSAAIFIIVSDCAKYVLVVAAEENTYWQINNPFSPTIILFPSDHGFSTTITIEIET